MPQPEPWLRGPIDGVPPVLVPLFHAFQHVREELAGIAASLTDEQIWAEPRGLTPVGFHIRHIGGATDRLGTYLRNQPISDAQLTTLAAESKPGATAAELLAELEANLTKIETYVRSMDPIALADPRTVGRKQLPSTVIGLLTHIAEHSLRHTGQAVTTAKLLKNLG